MDVKLVCVTVVLLSSPLLTLCDPLYVLSAPNLLRVGSSENVFVEAQDYSGADIDVRISVKNFPKKDKEMLSKSVTLTPGNNYQILTDIKIPLDENYFSDDPEVKQYVYIEARFPSHTLEKVVMVSFQSGYIFVQTDKPIYTPASAVQYRIFTLTPNLKPISSTSIMVDIMNPQGITVSSKNIFTEKGIKTDHYAIPDVASTGMWKVVTRYKNTPQKTFTADFEVKEYVLPTFEVTLKPTKSFFYVGDPSLTVNIEANYLFGQKVEGNAFVVFGVMDGEKKTSIPTSLQKIQIRKGEGTAELTREMITKAFRDINQLVGLSIYVSVSLLTESGSEMVEAERRGIQIVTSPYAIHFKKTSQYFKPGMPLSVSVYITNPDQTPAVNVEVEVNPGGVRGTTKANGIVKVTVNTPGGSSTLQITAKTKDPQLRDEQQAVKTMTAQAYVPKGGSNNYLHIGIDEAELQIGDQMKVNLNTGQSPGVKDQDYTYMILSKGQIVQADRFKRRGQSLVTLSLRVTKDMVPSFRFVAFYHVGSSEVVSDSVWVDVKDTCMGTLKLQVKNKRNTYGPGEEVNLQITGDSGARVGLLAVDKAVQILNKNRLTQTKIWDIIEANDNGCTAGGGRDSMGVFSDAGLMFESSTAGETNTRTVPKCSGQAKRKRRADSLLQITGSLASQYPGELKQCCVDGMRDNKLGYTCDRRATYIVDGPECVKVFLHCCKEIKTRKNMRTEEEELILARSDDDDDYYTDSDEITSRSQFPETWLWDLIDLCEDCRAPSKDETIQLKDSITTWQILAVSLSPTLGICVAEPEEIVVSKSFFIDLKIPYSAVRGEQLEIKAIIHNYTPNDLKRVRVEFMETADVCSSASKKGKHRIMVNVDKGSSVAVSYVIIPMTLGDHDIEVKAAKSDYEDGVKKTLKVVSEGVLFPLHQNVELDPVKNGEKPIVVRAEPPADQVPGTPADTFITITGRKISQTVEQIFSENFMSELIVQPSGCGEQNMYSITLPVIATHYLDKTNQWETVGLDRRRKAISYINTGYQGQLKYRKGEGSYSIWEDTPSSTWLTAYVAKVFAMASYLNIIENNVICSALKWLVLYKQLPDGSFKEEAPVHQSEMTGGVQGKDAEASLTAFVVIAMQEAREICAGSVNNLHSSIRRGIIFLEGQLPKLTNPYAVALTSYAMANEGKLNKEVLMKHSTQAGRVWNVAGQPYHSREATAYAVLALMKAQDFDRAGEPVRWLGRQQSHYGGAGTTQVTIMVFQAVAEYYTHIKDEQNFNLDVELSVAGRNAPDRWTIKRSNVHLTRSGKAKIDQDFNVTAKGTGTAILSVLTLYYARPVEKKSDCTFFDLTVKMEEMSETKPGAIASYNFTMDFFFKSDKLDATMTILDIGIPTGFDVDENDLKELSSGKERYIQQYEKNKVLSERGSLILYLNKVSHKVIEKLIFRMHKMLNVGLLQPAAVTIYEYYSPDARCTKFYHPERIDGVIERLCKGDVCVCAEENCTYQRINNVEEKNATKMMLERLDKACEPGMDYVYKVKVIEMALARDSDIYTMMVEKVLKEGSDDDVEGKVRLFLGRPSCRNRLALEEGKSYLIMGKSTDLPEFEGRLQYIFGEHTWVEYWPTQEESRTEEFKIKYSALTELQINLPLKGCTT
ncbi:complement C3-like [Pseudorasbora parva]|uniref:complement C3-like n=1 Tax=Pseudorasbora parva TaxID=51549 RepID=UPI00351EBC47